MNALIVGSAPDIALPTRREFDLLVVANGGARLAADAGFRNADLLVTTAYLLTAKTPYNDFVMVGWGGLSVGNVIVDEFGATCDERRLKQTGLKFLALSALSRAHRGVMISQAIGMPIGNGQTEAERCSTGVLAACIAASWGATSITVAGFSRMNGHVGNTHQHENGAHHLADDKVMTALARVVKLGTTNPQLAARLGLHHDRG